MANTNIDFYLTDLLELHIFLIGNVILHVLYHNHRSDSCVTSDTRVTMLHLITQITLNVYNWESFGDLIFDNQCCMFICTDIEGCGLICMQIII